MALVDTLRSGVATARAITLSFHVNVTIQQWIGQNSFGKAEYADTLTLKALVEQKSKSFKTRDGQEAVSKSYIAILEPITPATPTGDNTRENPIDERDVITLPDGTTGPILDVTGFLDGGTGVPFFSEIYLGRAEQATGI